MTRSVLVLDQANQHFAVLDDRMIARDGFEDSSLQIVAAENSKSKIFAQSIELGGGEEILDKVARDQFFRPGCRVVDRNRLRFRHARPDDYVPATETLLCCRAMESAPITG